MKWVFDLEMKYYNTNIFINSKQQDILRALHNNPGSVEHVEQCTGIAADDAKNELMALIRMGAVSSDVFGGTTEYWVNRDYFDPSQRPDPNFATGPIMRIDENGSVIGIGMI